MSLRIVLDSGVVSLLTHPDPKADSFACQQWLATHAAAGDRFVLSEIVDYEVRREYLRRNSRRAIRKLDLLAQQITFETLNTAIWKRAAQLWAYSRQHGHITAPPNDLDIDVLLAALAQSLDTTNDSVVIATTNVRHLAPFAEARQWFDI